ncbi:MAG: helix-turn-helix domain-containing protein, partial [Chloroflexota bacterium]|nr:helix-turn-helix domain-containing protein [Chloroflexota bacterium]
MDTKQRDSFGNLLRSYRRAAGLTQEELADRAGLSARAVGNLELGVSRRPRRDTVHLLADALGLSQADRETLLAARAPVTDDGGAERPHLPTGTVTFLFTDIEGSTRMWEENPDAMRGALSRHHAILQSAIESHGGYVFKTVGDAFCAAFATAPDALLAALEAQRSLHNERWDGVGPIRARMALHTGVAEVRDEDYYGLPLNRVSRILATGHG